MLNFQNRCRGGGGGLFSKGFFQHTYLNSSDYFFLPNSRLQFAQLQFLWGAAATPSRLVRLWRL
jgi:hypothetical protein